MPTTTYEHNPLAVDDDKPKRFRKDDKPKEPVYTTPVKCTMCSGTLHCPDDQDFDTFMMHENKKCLSSHDPICAAAVKRTSNAVIIARIKG